MGTPVFQTAFNRGELDPALFGRTDWQAYFSGARKLRNMVCRPAGGVVKRAGTEFVAAALRQDGPSRLIRFQFNVEQSYLLEFGGKGTISGRTTDVFRVFKDGGLVMKGAAPAVFQSYYSTDEIAKVRVCQMEDRMIFTHPNHPPRTLTRFNHDDWRWEDIIFGSSVTTPYLSLTADGRNEAGYVVTALTSGGEESLPSNSVSASKAPTNPTIISLPRPVTQMDYLDLRGFLLNYGLPVATDLLKMKYQEVMDFLKTLGYRTVGKGLYWESDGTGKWTHYNPRTGTSSERGYTGLMWFYTANYDSLIKEAVSAINDAFANTILADMRAQLQKYVDDHNNANTITGTNTLSWTAVSGAARYRVYRTSRQSDGTLKYLGIAEVTTTTHTDTNGAFMSPAVTPPKANEGTGTSESPFSGGGNYPGVCAFYQQRLTLGRTNNKPGSLWGSAVGTYKNFYRSDSSDTAAWEFTLWADEANELLWMVPLEDLLIGTAGGEFRMSGGSYIITPTNVNVNRQSNYGCSAVLPVIVGQSVLAVGRKGQALRAFQYNDTDKGYGGKHISHYAEHLFNNRRIVEMAYQYEPAYLLWLVMSDGALLSLTYMNEEDVLGWARHDTDGSFEAVASMISVEGEDEIWFQVARTVGGKTVRYIERLMEVQTDADDVTDAWYVDSGLARQGEPVSSFAGLSHLEGKTVVCLGDGNVYEDLKVTGGRITLPVAVRKAVVGLPFTAEVETMELEPAGGGILAANAKRPVTASVLLYHSRECQYGFAGNERNMQFLALPGQYIEPVTIRKNVTIPAPLNGDSSSIILKSSAPVPFGVLSLVLDLSVGVVSPRPGKALANG